MVGWYWASDDGGSSSGEKSRRRRRPTRLARYFAKSGLTCFALAVFFNVCWVLPKRRKLELEADYCGLKFAAKACFQLGSIPSHWDTLNFEDAVPEWISTHPAAIKRKDSILSLLPWAEGIRTAGGCDC